MATPAVIETNKIVTLVMARAEVKAGKTEAKQVVVAAARVP